MSDEIHPWNSHIWRQLMADGERCTHAWLFSGVSGLGKRVLAFRLARYYLCEQAELSARARSRGSALFAAGTHPDLHVLMPEDHALDAAAPGSRYAGRYAASSARGARPKSVITVDQIRALIAQLATHAHAGGLRVVIIDPAERLYPNAADALLKILEEPPDATVFILISEDRTGLPATVRSRASRVDFHIPDRARALEWLAARVEDSQNPATLLEWAGGAPLAAMRLYKENYDSVRPQWVQGVESLWQATGDPVSVAAVWQEIGVAASLQWLHGFVTDLVRISLAPAPPALFNPDLQTLLQESAKRIDLRRAFHLWERIGAMRQETNGPLEQKLMLEDLLIELRNVAAMWR